MANQFKEAAEKKRQEAERRRREAEEKARLEAEARAQQEADERAKKEAEVQQEVPDETGEEEKSQPMDAQAGVFGLKGKKVHERKTANLNILLKPSVKKRLKDESDRGEIKSANDVINVQLDKYYAVKDAIASGEVKTREELERFVIREYLDK